MEKKFCSLEKDSESETTIEADRDAKRHFNFDHDLSLIYCKPRSCPQSDCNYACGASLMLWHIKTYHPSTWRPYSQESVFVGDDLQLTVNLKNMQRDTINILRVLAYAGRRNELRPAERKLCFKNKDMDKNETDLEQNLPMMIMGCYTNFISLCKSNLELSREQLDPKADVFITWLSSPYQCDNIYLALKMYNTEMSVSDSAILKLKRLPEVKEEFRNVLSDMSNRFMLSNADLKKYVSEEGSMKIEMTIDEILCN